MQIKVLVTIGLVFFTKVLAAQNNKAPLTAEMLWRLGRVAGTGVTHDKQWVVFNITTPDIEGNKKITKIYKISAKGGQAQEIINGENPLPDKDIAPNAMFKIKLKDVKCTKNLAQDFYPHLNKADVKIYNELNYRQWDSWADGNFSHLFVTSLFNNVEGANYRDIMMGRPFDCPTKPLGGEADYTWNPGSTKIIYVVKAHYGTHYAISTNTDIIEYDVYTGIETNLTLDNSGVDTNPAFNSHGDLAWLSMKRDGYESDKMDLKLMQKNIQINLTEKRDDLHVQGFKWSDDGSKIFFWAPIKGAIQLFEVNSPADAEALIQIRQITDGGFDINNVVGQVGEKLIVSRTDMNHAAELFELDIATGSMAQLTHVNDSLYDKIAMSRIEKRVIKTTDNKDMPAWVIYPPGFDSSLKYPTLLYCQGGPQSPLTQFYSFRWNFQLMAANGYIVIAPCRRGMPGLGTAWNEAVSKHHGGLAIQDYLSAIDDIKKEPFVDASRLGCVGASYGGYSVFMLAGLHNGRFKTFISHAGIFDTKSMYGSTDEVFFVNWDYGGPYWDETNADAKNAYTKYSPSNFVGKWDTPMLIFQGGKDYRVPDDQALQAFQALQLRAIKSRLIYLPSENHWVSAPQNALVWQHEFFKWLKETM